MISTYLYIYTYLYGDIIFLNHRLLGALTPQVAFKERIALMLGLDHKQIFNCKARSVDCFVNSSVFVGAR